jgi:hypothetical protein
MSAQPAGGEPAEMGRRHSSQQCHGHLPEIHQPVSLEQRYADR